MRALQDAFAGCKEQFAVPLHVWSPELIVDLPKGQNSCATSSRLRKGPIGIRCERVTANLMTSNSALQLVITLKPKRVRRTTTYVAYGTTGPACDLAISACLR